MCGIVCAFKLKQSSEKLRAQLLEMSKKLRHRGPDSSGIYADKNAILANERLAIVDLSSGEQPIFNATKTKVLVANGEIYNHGILKEDTPDYQYTTHSDCEVLLALYEIEGADFIHKLNGIFAFALYDTETGNYLIARDHMGIIPLYIGWDEHGTFYVASELKALEGICQNNEVFPPGHYMTNDSTEFIKWYKPTWRSYEDVKNNPTCVDNLHRALDRAVHRQLISDVPYGVLLSGGLDSSIISALVKKNAEKRNEEPDKTGAWRPNIHSFATGLEGSPDLKAARLVADHLGTVHHEVLFNIQEGLDALRDVIYHLETYDVTIIRSSTPMFLMAKAIKAMGIKMVLSGEGADDIFGGYLYFHKAPNAKAFHEETVRKLDKLYLYDCLRTNKSLAAWGIEGRVPFLDKEFIDVAMSINPQDKMVKDGRIEKWILRKAFGEMLPIKVAWRQKEQFADGVGYSWIDTLKKKISNEVSDEQLENAHFIFPFQPPKNKEEFYYRRIFAEHFPSEAAARTVHSETSMACISAAALEWDESFKNINDPSGRAISNVHSAAY